MSTLAKPRTARVPIDRATIDSPDAPPRAERWPRLWPVWIAAAVLLGFVHLWLTIGFGLVFPSHGFWHSVLGDTSMNVLGAEAFQRDSVWHFPIATTTRVLSGGSPVSIVYTDSAPWIAVVLKALGLGVEDVSIMGVVAVLSVVLQPIAFALLLLALGVRRVESVLVGAILGSLLPAWYMRLVWHVALSSHWLVVLALAVAATAIRAGVSWRVIAGLAALGALSIGIHAYLFVMVAAIAAGALLADVARVGTKAVPRAAAGLALFLVCSGVSAWVLGYGGGGGVGGFGRFSMNALSPLIPQKSGVALALLGYSRNFLDATGGQYEGFNYLGAGVLLCIGAAVLAMVRHRPAFAAWRPAMPLIAVLFALTALALSNKAYAGSWLVANVPLPSGLMALLDEVRSSGRMFWPVAYMALAGAILALDRLPSRELAGAALAGALTLQGIDTGELRRILITEYWPRPGRKPMFDASLWETNGRFAGRDLRMIPSYLCTPDDHEIMRQAALTVVRSGGTVDGGPIARVDPSLCSGEAVARAVSNPRLGQIDLLMTRFLPAAIVDRTARSRPCTAVSGGLLCGDEGELSSP